jgi:hypothetical protein
VYTPARDEAGHGLLHTQPLQLLQEGRGTGGAAVTRVKALQSEWCCRYTQRTVKRHVAAVA